ncbi:TIR domain-containing protein, partial [Candidatus Poribacteria bacterium]|nr:TIR domain-containing protein [Candidatus Poribacteria bacterium]
MMQLRYWRKTMAKNPKVFISYSHDSPEHKQWVSELAARLRRDIVDLILYQGNPDLDEDATQFMESGVRDSDRVLVVCTDKYVSKANVGEDGVGYEPMIVTSKLVEDLGTNKFIPIIRQTLVEDKTPEFLKERAYVDFTDDTQFEAKFEELLYDRLLLPPLQLPLIPYIESLHVKT